MRIQAVVLQLIPAREYDQLAVCYTENGGKHVYQAKGASRPASLQRQHMEVFNIIDFSPIESTHIPIIASCSSTRTFPNMKKSLPALAVAFFVSECFKKFVFADESDPALWKYCVHTLEHLDRLSTELNVDWKKCFDDSYHEFFTVMGHGSQPEISDLGYTKLDSLSFFNSVVA